MLLVGGIAMREKVPVDTDEVDDELELLDEELKQQISDGYGAYLHDETKDLETLIADLRDELKPQKTEAQ
jgi:hypothetical protein